MAGLSFPWDTPPEPGGWRQVDEGLLWIRLPLPMALDHVNVYALRDAQGWTIVDTGLSTRKTKAMWQTLMQGPLAGAPIWRVILTHHHPDHVGLAGWFASEFGAEIWASRTSWLMARMLQLDVQDVPVQETITFWERAGMAPEIIEERKSGRPFNFADCVEPIPLGFHRLKQDDVIEVGGRLWHVHMGNGHAPEHATLWSQDGQYVLAGDQIISSISPNLGVYATEPEADPVGDWIEACERLAQIATEDHLVLSGHKLPFRGVPLRLCHLIENHHSALARLLDWLDTPKSAAECFPVLFKRTIGDGEYGLALVEAVAHLNHLHQSGAIRRELCGDGAYRFQKMDAT